MSAILIVGLGNPGKSYEKTRHNLGFDVVRALADGWTLSFKKVDKLEGELAIGNVGDRKLYLFLPMTYMNSSGRAVKKAVDYYKISLGEGESSRNFLVVVDDVYVTFGKMRLRAEGGAGGHNGLKSLNEYLHTTYYPRLRMGVGPKPENLGLEDFVLGSYSSDEQIKMASFVERGVEALSCWIRDGIEKACQRIAMLDD